MGPWTLDIWGLMAVIGLVLGAMVYGATPKRIRGGIIVTMLVGAVAAVSIAWIGVQLGVASQGTMVGFIVGTIGTALVLAVWRMTMAEA